MSEDPTKDLLKGSSFEERVLSEFAGMRTEFVGIRGEFVVIRSEVAGNRVEFAGIRDELAAIRNELAAIRADIVRLDARQQKFEERLTTLEEKVDSRLSETRPIWESVQLAIKRLDSKFDVVLSDLYDVRANYKNLDKRLTELEAL